MADPRCHWSEAERHPCSFCGAYRCDWLHPTNGWAVHTACARSVFVGLGHAIRRFARRAEVEGLRETVREESSEFAYERHAMRWDDAEVARGRMDAALDRLAALAIEGAGR